MHILTHPNHVRRVLTNEMEIFRRQARHLVRWLAHNCRERPLAVILGGSCNGLSFSRSLGRRGIPTLMLESDRLLGIYTRFGKVAILPPVETHAREWVELLEHIGAHLPIPGVLFPTSDAHTLLIARHRATLERFFRFLTPGLEILEQLINKRSQYPAAAAAGVPMPAVHFPESIHDVHRLAGAIPYPCILKPYDSHAARKKMEMKKVLLVHSAAELMSEYERITGRNVPLMIQEIVPGRDSDLFGYLAFWDQDGNERAWLTKRKLRQFPPGFGDGSLQETVEAPLVAELSRRLLRKFRYRGFVGVEFKLDARDQTYRLIEINPRTVSGNQLAISAGIDFPWIGYRYLTGAESDSEPKPHARPGIKYINEEWDFQAYLALRRTGELTFWRWLRSLRGVKARGIWAWDDPLPMVVGLRRLVRR
jgi:D-aspartate ligase